MGQLAIPSPYYLSWTLSDLEIVACNLRNLIHSTLFCLSIWSTCLFCLWSYCPVCRRRQVAAPPSHCSCLEIYISQKIRLCKGDFEGKFQFNLQAKSITFLGWKFRFTIQQGLEIHGLEEHGPCRYTVFNWIPKHLRYTVFGQKPWRCTVF